MESSYIQTHHTTMGTKTAVSFANIFMPNYSQSLSKTVFKVIPSFCTAHPLLRITLLHPRWRRFFPLARKEQTRAAFAELKLLFAIIMLSKNKKRKEMCMIPKSAVIFYFAAVELWNY